MFCSNFNLMAETMFCHKESSGEEVSSKGGEREWGRTRGDSGESSWSEATSEPKEGTLEIIEASPSRFTFSSYPPSSPVGAEDEPLGGTLLKEWSHVYPGA